jgi:ABC-2 type transport system ATP-binding protein
MMTAICAEGLTRRFGDLVAVENLSLEVGEGEIFVFLAPNGAGKTTTLRMLCALIQTTSGRAVVAGHVLGKEDDQIRRKVGILTESPGLYDRLSAEDNLRFFAHLYDVDDIEGQVERYLRMLGLWERRTESAATFSKGMRQKLAIARALLHEPQILFLDEPTSGLDPEMAHLVRAFIEDLKQAGRTIFLCTHNLDEADRLCDRIAVFNTHLVAVDTPQALRSRLYDRIVVFHLTKADLAYADRLRANPAVRSVEVVENKLVVALDDPEVHNPDLIAALVEAGARIQFVGELRRSLEEVYMRLVNSSE